VLIAFGIVNKSDTIANNPTERSERRMQG
jgi:hypothetical protein